MMRIEGITIKNYRSFDNDGIELENLGNINILIGKNNSGKSNVLKFISSLNRFLTINSSNMGYLKTNDFYNYNEQNDVACSLKVNKGMLYLPDAILEYFKNIDSVIINYKYSTESRYFLESEDFLRNIIPNNDKVLNLNYLLEFKFLGSSYDEFLKHLRGWIYINNKNVCLLSSFRKIEFNKGIEKSDTNYQLRAPDGFDLINRLNDMKNPNHENLKEKIKFENIENFIKEILNENNLTLEISTENNYLRELSLRINGSQYPLDNLGTGIHQLIILASTVAVLQDYLICIEEPEIFVHPEIQRKFLSYLLKTDNQYFISTHSNTFINIEGIDVYHISHDGKKSSAKKVITSTERNILLDDLGYRASDLLQTNYLLWVEGPSDKIYIDHWLKSINKDLIEDIHYSIMFYGGRLLSHLTADKNALNDFINLSKINRNVGIVIDSDIKVNKNSINKTKRRIVNEFRKNNYFSWVTKGKEIENYISENDLINAVKTVAKSKDIEIDYGELKPLNVYKIKEKTKEIDKILLARTITKSKLDMNVLDLKERINELIIRIKEANNL